MPLTRTFEGYAPPRRYDSLPFTKAQIRESATADGTYTTLETINLSPVDADPAAPATRNFTTALATLEDGWYIIRWEDASASTFDSDPIRYQQSAGQYVTIAEIREALGLDDTALPDAAAQSLADDASDWIDAQLGARETDALTGRKVIEEEVEPWQWAKLKRATLKVAARLHAEPSILSSPQWDVVKGPDFETSGRLTPGADMFGSDVSALLDQSGLRVLSRVFGIGRDQPPWYEFSYNVPDYE